MNSALLIQGANMVALGHRQPEFYGTTTVAELDELMLATAPDYGLDLTIAYANREGDAIALLEEAEINGTEGVLMNPAGFLYAGHSLEARLRLLTIPFIEIHMTNIEKRGKQSATATAAGGMIAGFGVNSYIVALAALRAMLDRDITG